MNPPLVGTNCSNVQYSAWPTGAVDAIAALRPQALLFYAYAATIPASKAHAADLKHLIANLPTPPLVLLRIAGDMTPQDPLGRADEAVARWHVVGLRTAQLVTMNEWNLSTEAPPKPLAQWVTWWERHLTRLAELLPDVPRHLAALSPSVPDYLRWYEALAGSAVIRQLADVVDIHAYDEGTLVSATEVVTGLFPASGICLTEFNRVLPSRVATLAPTLDAALWFGAALTADWQQYDLLRLPTERQDFIATIRGETMPDPTPTPPTRWARGADVSNNNTILDWPTFARSLDFVAMKASEGTTFRDPDFAANWRAAGDARLARIAYHFARPSANTGAAEAAFFLATVGELAAGDCLALDLEDTRVAANADLLAYTLDWLRTVAATVGFAPLLYSGDWYLRPHNLEGNAELATHGLWYAAYQPTAPTSPSAWPFWALWQYGAGPVPGVRGTVDLDVFNGEVAQLRRYGRPN